MYMRLSQVQGTDLAHTLSFIATGILAGTRIIAAPKQLRQRQAALIEGKE
jgi:hypothetical protein